MSNKVRDRTLCAWCGRPVFGYKMYNGEFLCAGCIAGKETDMDDWERYYDRWKTNPPERHKSSNCICCMCKEELHPDEEYYELDGDIYCEDCADNWLKQQRNWVTEDMAYGDR